MQNLELSQWGLPDGVLEQYKKRGIHRMFAWQLECLTTGNVLNGENLVYSAPTSAGKTLVAEILVAQTIFDKKKKALIILPFVSVVREKMFYFQDMFSANGIRVEGFMGGHTPSASFQQVSMGVCTIEKANSLINRMLEEKTLANLGIVVVDELHMLGDPYRGYLLELLLTKLLYMSSVLKDMSLQIVGMSATLPNLNMLAKWLKAKLYYTDFRPIPLQERVKCGRQLFNSKLEKVGDITPLDGATGDDSEDVGQICIETFRNGHSVLIFCPTKVWCESLAIKLATFFRKLGCSESAAQEGSAGWILRQQLDLNRINEVISHLKMSAVGLDKELAKTVSFGVAFHHAGLTLDERDIIEGSFRNGSLRVVCATSTLSSGVNLPARRVIIRSPMSHGGVMDILTYRQMIGRAGRMGKDTEGESILICKSNEMQACRQLMAGTLKPIESCLGSGRLSASLKRAILEVVASGIATTPEQVAAYASSTFLASSSRKDLQDPLTSCLEFLLESELIRMQAGGSYAPTPLGQACLASSLPPDEGLALFKELERARRCFVLDSDLHLIYQVTPYSVSEQWSKIDWLHVLNILEELSPSMRRVADLVGVQDSFLVKVVKGAVNFSLPEQRSKLSILRRFYTALALQDLVNEVPLSEVAVKYDCSKGMLQSLQQSAATYAGMVSEFAKRLRWGTMEVLIAQFHERLQFGVQKELCELMRLSSLNGVRARTLFNAGFTSLSDIANSDAETLEAALLAATPFQTKMQIAGETGYEFEHRTRFNSVWITGKAGLSIRQAAEDLVNEARNLLELELGVVAVWSNRQEVSSQKVSQTITGKAKGVEVNHAATILSHGTNHKTDLEIADVEACDRTSKTNATGVNGASSGKLQSAEEPNVARQEPISTNKKLRKCHVENSEEAVEQVVLNCGVKLHNNNNDSLVTSLKEDGDLNVLQVNEATHILKLDTKQLNSCVPMPTSINIGSTVDHKAAEPEKTADSSEFGGKKDGQLGDSFLNSACDWDLTTLESISKSESVNKTEGVREVFKVPPADIFVNRNVSDDANKEKASEISSKKSYADELLNSACDWNFDGVLTNDLARLQCTGKNACGENRSTTGEVKNPFERPEVNSVALVRANLSRAMSKGNDNSNKKCESDQLLNSVCDWNLDGISKVGCELEIVNSVPVAKDNCVDKLIGKAKNQESKLKEYCEDYFGTTLTSSAFQSPVNQRSASNSCSVIVRSRYSIDLFEESPKPTSTPNTTPKAKVKSLQSPDLFSQSLTFDTQLGHICDSEGSAENSPQKSDDHGFFSDSSPVIVAEVSVSEQTPPILARPAESNVLVPDSKKGKSSPDTIAESDDSTADESFLSRRMTYRKRHLLNHTSLKGKRGALLAGVETPVPEAKKRKASQDIIIGSDDSTAEESHSCWQGVIRRPRLKRRKDDEPPLVTLDSSDDEEIAPTPQVTRSLTLGSPRRSTAIARCLSLASPRRGTQALLTRIKGLGYSGPSQNEATTTRSAQPEIMEIDDDDMKVCADKTGGITGIIKVCSDNSDELKNSKGDAIANEEAKALSLSDVNWETLNLVDVCGNSSVFKSFREELNEQQIVGVALGCGKVVKQTKTCIGANLIKNIEKEEKEEGVVALCEQQFEDLILDGVAFYWNENNVFYMKMNTGISNEECIDVLKILTANNRKIRVFDMKEQMKVFGRYTSLPIDGNFEDPKVASWLTSTTSQDNGLKRIIAEVLPQAIRLSEMLGPVKGTSSCAMDVNSHVPAKTRACVEAYLTYYLMEAIVPFLRTNQMLQLFHEIEMPTLLVLIEMENAGFEFDEAKLKAAKVELESHVVALEQRAHVLAGRKFAVSSYAAVGKVLHNELRLGKNILDPKKKYGTSKDVLELLAYQTKHPLPGIIIQWRKMKSILLKVIFPLLQLLPQTRVYGSSQTFTVTGRISMKEPNLQNIPRDFNIVRDSDGPASSVRLRDMFVPSQGFILLSADYCQVELRLLACLSKDEALINTITESSDIFVDIAAAINKVAKGLVSPEQRQRAKQTCYGIIYGIGIKALAQQLQLSEDAAQTLYNDFKTNYQGVREYLLKTVSDCQLKGYVETVSGRRRYLPAIKSSNSAHRSEAERQAVNTTVQGSAADLVKTAMAKFRNQCNSNFNVRGKVKLILHLHDELIYEVEESVLPIVAVLLKNCMENTMALPVPFPVKVRTGTSWGQLRDFSLS